MNLDSMLFDFDLSLTNEDEFLNKLYESIGAPYASSALYETSQYNSAFSNYSVLSEAVDKINNITIELKDIKNSKDKNVFKRLTNTIRDLFSWWYKEDPYKQHKTLRIVLKLILFALGIAISIYAPGKNIMINKIATSNVGKKISKVAYKGDNRFIKSFASDQAIFLQFVRVIYGNIFKIIKNIDNTIYEKININNIHANIKEYDKTIDKLNDLISKVDDPTIKDQLIKSKKSAEDSLAELIKVRDKIRTKELKKTTKQNKENN